MDKKLVGLLTIFFLLFGLFTTVLIFERPLIRFTKAKDELIPSPEKSIVFAWPLKLSADGRSTSQITVFVRNRDGGALSNKKVTISTNLGLLNSPSAVTNKNGKVEFTLSSTSAGVAEISASVDDSTQLTQKVSIKFD